MKRLVSIFLLLCLGTVPVLSNATVTVGDVDVLLELYYKGEPEDKDAARTAIQNQTVAILNKKISFGSAITELCDVLGIDEPYAECIAFSHSFKDLMQISDETVLNNNEDLLLAELKNTLGSQRFPDCESVSQTAIEMEERYSEITDAPSLYSCDCDADFDAGTFTFECTKEDGKPGFYVEGKLDKRSRTNG